MSFYLRQRWQDRRLVYNDTDLGGHIEVHSRFMDELWIPDLTFINEKDSHFHEVTKPSRMLNLFPDGRISYSVRYDVFHMINIRISFSDAKLIGASSSSDVLHNV